MLSLNDKQHLKILRREIEIGLAVHSKQGGAGAMLDGLKFSAGNIKFEGDGSSCKVTLTVERSDAKPQEQRHWDSYAESYGFKKSDLFKTFNRTNGQAATIVGLCPARTKFPVMVDTSKGRILITLEEALRHLRKEAA